MRNHDPYVIDILDVALGVVECLSDESRLYGASELARKLGINRTRVFRILRTLEWRGYVEYDENAQAYRLGVKFLQIGENVRERLDLRREAEPVLVELARQTGDSAHLLILRGDHAVTIDRRQGENRLQVASPIGQSLPLYVGASPKILLAFLPEAEQERIIQSTEFERFTENTITDAGRLRRCLQRIREDGYVVDEEDYEQGVYAIGAPVRDITGRVVAGITITTPATRYSPRRRDELIALITEAAQKLSRKLGHQMDAPAELRTAPRNDAVVAARRQGHVHN
jgi:DNA-binding IclR family transcriptional regulator